MFPGERLEEQKRFCRCLILRLLVRRFLRIIGWLVAIQAIFVGLFAATLLSGSWVEPGYPTFIRIAVIVLGGLLPIVLSLIALHDPRTAAQFGLPLAVLTFLPQFVTIGGSYRVLLGKVGGVSRLHCLCSSSPFPSSSGEFPRAWAGQFRFNAHFGRSLRAIRSHRASRWLRFCSWSRLAPFLWCRGFLPSEIVLGDRYSMNAVSLVASISPRRSFSSGHGLLTGFCAGGRRCGPSLAHKNDSASDLEVPRFVILRGGFEAADQSREYFVESTGSSNTVLGHLAPVTEPSNCGHTAPLEDAGAWIRVLREGAPKSGARLIGRVYVGVPYDQRGKKAAPGTHVNLDATSGTITSVADADGIYDFTSVPSGTYTLHATVTEPDGRSFSDTQPLRLKEGEVRDWDVYAR
jgi:hypothetical protein